MASIWMPFGGTPLASRRASAPRPLILTSLMIVVVDDPAQVQISESSRATEVELDESIGWEYARMGAAMVG